MTTTDFNVCLRDMQDHTVAVLTAKSMPPTTGCTTSNPPRTSSGRPR